MVIETVDNCDHCRMEVIIVMFISTLLWHIREKCLLPRLLPGQPLLCMELPALTD